MSQPGDENTNDPFAPPPEQPPVAQPPPSQGPPPGWSAPPQGPPPSYGQQPQPPSPYGAPPGWTQPQHPAPFGAPSGVKPPNYLPWAIVATILCCLPLGVASIVFANQVNVKYAQGDLAGANEASQKAKNFAIASAIIGPVIMIIYLLAAGSHS
jgi:hypothetical protein